MSKGYTAQYVRTLVRKHKAPLKKRIKELEARLEKATQLIDKEITRIATLGEK